MRGDLAQCSTQEHRRNQHKERSKQAQQVKHNTEQHGPQTVRNSGSSAVVASLGWLPGAEDRLDMLRKLFKRTQKSRSEFSCSALKRGIAVELLTAVLVPVHTCKSFITMYMVLSSLTMVLLLLQLCWCSVGSLPTVAQQQQQYE